MSAGIAARAALALQWQDGEVDYCRALLMTRGNKSVPADAIQSYLDVQRAGATRALAYARLHGQRDAQAIAQAAVDELDTLILAWARVSGGFNNE